MEFYVACPREFSQAMRAYFPIYECPPAIAVTINRRALIDESVVSGGIWKNSNERRRNSLLRCNWIMHPRNELGAERLQDNRDVGLSSTRKHNVRISQRDQWKSPFFDNSATGIKRISIICRYRYIKFL